MGKLFVTVLFLLAACLIMYLLHKLVLKTSYDRDMRFFHNRYIVALFLFLLIFFNTFTFSLALTLADFVINHEALQDFWAFVMPERRYEVVYLMLVLLLINILIMLLVAILLFIVRSIFKNHMSIYNVSKLSFNEQLTHFPWIFTGFVYGENEEEGSYELNDLGFTMGFWAKRMKNVLLILFGVEMIFLLIAVFSPKEALANVANNFVQGWYMLPMAGYLLLEQIQLFLEGDRDFEAGSFGTEEIGEKWEGRIEALPQIYQEEFAGSKALLRYYAGQDMRIMRDGLAHNGLNNNQLDECDQPEILFLLSNQLKEAGVKQNTSFQNSLVALLNGKSINIRDYIQGEFLVYLAVYMNFFVSQRQTFLLLCETTERAEKIKDALVEALAKINKIHSIWKVADIHVADSNEEMHILVCSYEDFVNHRLVEKRNDFFRNLSTVILADVLKFSAEGNVQKELVFTEFEKLKQKIQYVIVSREDNDFLRTAFEYYIGDEIIAYKNDSIKQNLHVMVWKEESIHKVQRCLGIGDEKSDYMGVSVPLALVGVKYDLPTVSVFSNEGKGYHTYEEIMKMEKHEVSKFLKWDVDLEKVIRFDRFSIMAKNEIEMFILYDARYNFYSMLWSWMKYGGTKGTLIHVVSPPYMLREYFADNLDKLIVRNNDYAPLISYQSSLKYSRFLEILIDLSNAGLYEEQIEKKNKEYRWGYANVTEVLSDSLKHVLKEQEFYNIYECFRFEEHSVFDPDTDRFEKHTLVKLIDENIRRRIHKQMTFAQIVTKNNTLEAIPVLKHNISNHFLRGQEVPINGHMQRILNVNKGMIFTEQVIPADKKEYYQCSEFVISKLKKTDECVDRDIIDFNLFSGVVERFIYGYWSCNDQINLVKENGAKLNSICDSSGNPLRNKMDNVHIMEMRMKRECFGEQSEQAALLAAYMLQEIFKTLFPFNHMNLFATVNYDPDLDNNTELKYWEKLMQQTGKMSLEDKIHSLVPFVRTTESEREKNKEYVRLYVIEYSSLEVGMVSSLYENRMRVFQIILSYLSWYMKNSKSKVPVENEEIYEEQKDGITPSYLNFGGDSIPECFAPEALVEFCEMLLPSYEEQESNANKTSNVKPEYTCTFCGKPALFTCRMDDERRMCRSCKQQQVGQRDEIKDLYRETVDFLCNTYHIKLRKSIHLRLKSADSIRKKCQYSGAGRILGFYNSGSHELWVEARGPRNAVQDTMIHELTHCWQFDNTNVAKLKRKYKDKYLLFLEGHSSYMEVDAMKKLGEEEYADFIERQLMLREDEYGAGYRMLKEYLETEAEKGSHYTPYEAFKNLLNNL